MSKISIGYEMSYTDGGWSGAPAELFAITNGSYQVVETGKMFSTSETL